MMTQGKKNRKHKKPARARRRHHDKAGTVPGTLAIPEGSQEPVISAILYNEHDFTQRAIATADEIPALISDNATTWINVEGLGNAALLQQLGDIFSLHPLALEDVTNNHHRAKVEEYDNHLFVIMHMMKIVEGQLEREQISIFIGKNYVLTIQEGADGDVLNPVRERLRRGEGRLIRKAAADYLAYAIIDTIIDEYFPVTEHLGDAISAVEDQVLENPAAPLLPIPMS